MTDATTFRAQVARGDMLTGTFMKTPAVDVLEVLILAGLDFVCIDQEHAPFDRAALNVCGAVARAANFPLLVRVPSGAPEHILAALDMGATGIVVPHVMDATMAARVAKQARFGHGGRGYAGSTRWAGFGTQAMPDLLARSQTETLIIAQIEDPEAVDHAAEIAATPGIDAIFLGPADLTVAYGRTAQPNPDLDAATAKVGAAAKAAGKAYMTFVADAAGARDRAAHGFTVFFVASEHAWIISGARAVIAGVKAI